MSFRVGSKVAYPHSGAGQVVDVRMVDPGGTGDETEYLVVDFELPEVPRLQVPAERAAELGLRAVTGPTEMRRIKQMLSEPARSMPKNWARRSKQLTGMLTDGDITEIVEVVRFLSRLRVERGSISRFETDLLLKARGYLGSEAALSLGVKNPQAWIDDGLDLAEAA